MRSEASSYRDARREKFLRASFMASRPMNAARGFSCTIIFLFSDPSSPAFVRGRGRQARLSLLDCATIVTGGRGWCRWHYADRKPFAANATEIWWLCGGGSSNPRRRPQHPHPHGPLLARSQDEKCAARPLPRKNVGEGVGIVDARAATSSRIACCRTGSSAAPRSVASAADRPSLPCLS